MTINGTININGTVYKFETDEVDKAIKAIVLLSGKENGENNNAIEVLRSIADNLNNTESELDEYVEDEDDEELCDIAYEDGYDAGYSGVCCIGDNPYDRGTPTYTHWVEGYRDGIDDYED